MLMTRRGYDRKGEPAYRNRIVYDKGDNYYYNDKGESDRLPRS